MSRLGLVFGGSRGIGRAVCLLSAQKGHRVMVVSRSEAAARAVADSLPGEAHLGLSCDVSKEDEVQNVFEIISKNCGTLGYLVNAAGINRNQLLVRTNSEDMLSVLHTNLLGSMFTCRAAVRSMMRHGGAIVNIGGLNLVGSSRANVLPPALTFTPENISSPDQNTAVSSGSVVGVKGNPGQSVYSASKAGLEGFTRSLAKEVASRNIRVNLVAPGFIRTDMTTGLETEELEKKILLGGFGKPTDVAQAVHFLLESSYVTGQTLKVDGGLQLTM